MTYTNGQIGTALRAALDKMGEDYVYENISGDNCVYAVGGEPSCIVGHVLHALDPDMFEKVVQFESNPIKNKGDTSFANVVEALRLPFHTDQKYALDCIQADQDAHAPWGEAVAVGWIGKLGERLPDSIPDGVDIHGEES